MEFPSIFFSSIVILAVIASCHCKETAQFNNPSSHMATSSGGDSAHHQTQKRSAAGLLQADDSGAMGPGGAQLVQDPADAIFLDASPFATGGDDDLTDSLDKRSSLFRFGKRGGSLFRFGKRSSLFRFGKRDGTLFRFGKRSGNSDLAADKRTLFRFGKRSDLADLLAGLYYDRYGPVYELAADDSASVKRNVDSFHWGRESDK